MTGISLAGSGDRAALMRIADWLTVAIAVSLPWSTSTTAILVVLWVLALIPTLDWDDLRRTVLMPAGGLPVLLFALGALGTAWADVSLIDRWGGLDSFFKLLVIPLLFVQFRRSERGLCVFGLYVGSCVVLLLATTYVQWFPSLSPVGLVADRVLVKNGPTQSGEFVTCIFGLLYLAVEAVHRRQWGWLATIAVIVLGMIANMTYVTTSRTALYMIPVLLVLFAVTRLNARGIAILIACAGAVSAIAWFSSPYLRERVTGPWTEIRHYEKSDEQNSSSERIVFTKRSLRFILEAPIIGHGTGSIHALFEKSSAGRSGAEGAATTNPHNQTFAVAIQLGLIGALVLWAMWIAHLLLFRGGGLAAWVGLLVVVQNIVGSLFNSHLFDFAQGWVYVIGVGVAGGMVLKARAVKGERGATP
jgi:O-antigen ligase